MFLLFVLFYKWLINIGRCTCHSYQRTTHRSGFSPFQHVDSGGWTQVVSLGSKHPYPLSHVSDPFLTLKISFCFIYMSLHRNGFRVCGWVTEEAKSLGPGVVSHLMRVLGIKFRSSRRAVSTLSAELSLQFLGFLFILFYFALLFAVFKTGCWYAAWSWNSLSRSQRPELSLNLPPVFLKCYA